MLPRVNVDVGAKALSIETVLLEPAVTISMETAPSFIKRVLAVHTAPKANEDMDGTVLRSESDATGYKLQMPSKPIMKLLFDTKSEMERVLAYLGVLSTTDVEAIFDNQLTKWTSTLRSQNVKAVGSTFENALQRSYFKSNNGLKSAMFNVVEQVLGEVG